MHAIFVTGTPGVGKTTLSALLRERIKIPYINLGEFALKLNLIKEVDVERGVPAVDAKRLRKVLLEKLEEAGGDMLIDSHFLLKIPVKYNPFVFVLRCRPDVLLERLRARFDERKTAENVWSEILDYCLIEAINFYGKHRVHEIDTTHRSAREVISEVMKVLRGEAKPKQGIYDWVSFIERSGKLKTFIELERRFMGELPSGEMRPL